MTAFPTSSASQFADYLTLRLPEYNRKDVILNETQSQNYALSLFYKNGRAETEKNLGAGEPVTDRVQLTDDDNTREIQPGEQRSLSRASVLTTISAGPRYIETSSHWTRAEVRITGDPENRIKNLKERYVKTPKANHFNAIERRLWAKPHASMEEIGAVRGQMISLPCINSEEPNGAVTGLSTIHQAAPASLALWRNQRVTYDAGAWTDPLTGLRAAFQKMASLLNFAPVAQAASMNFEGSESNYRFICTNLDGMNMYASMLTTLNQMMPKAQDPAYTGPAFFGHAVVYIPYLDSALLNSQDGTAYSTAWPTGKPRFHWFDPEYVYLKHDPQEFMTMSEILSGSAENRPDVELFYIRSRMTLFTHSRRRGCGVIVPKLASE